jgi:uncharacterized protein
MNQTSIPPSTALITGASVGIGRELARVFAGHGHDLVLVARDGARLEKVAAECRSVGGVKARVLVQDLSSPGASAEVFDELERGGIAVDILVNNAGFGTHGKFAAIDLDSDVRLLQVNIVSLTSLTKLLIAAMIARGTGKVLNVASTAAFLPGPWMATYYASKAYVLSFSEAIASELAAHNITVTTLCPGPVNTEFQKRAGIEGSRLFRGGAMDAKTVALAGYHGMMRGRRIVIPGASNRLAAGATRLVPRRLLAWIAGKLNQVH